MAYIVAAGYLITHQGANVLVSPSPPKKRAMEIMEHVVAVNKKVLVEEHPSQLASQHMLAIAYQVDGQVRGY
jgi:hypothetical protein